MKGASSDYVGVSFCKVTNKWKATKRLNKKTHHLGYFNTEKEAIKARRKADLELGGTQSKNKNYENEIFYPWKIIGDTGEIDKNNQGRIVLIRNIENGEVSKCELSQLKGGKIKGMKGKQRLPKSGEKYIYFRANKNKYEVAIYINKKETKIIGYFDTLDEAIKKRDNFINKNRKR